MRYRDHGSRAVQSEISAPPPAPKPAKLSPSSRVTEWRVAGDSQSAGSPLLVRIPDRRPSEQTSRAASARWLLASRCKGWARQFIPSNLGPKRKHTSLLGPVTKQQLRSEDTGLQNSAPQALRHCPQKARGSTRGILGPGFQSGERGGWVPGTEYDQ